MKPVDSAATGSAVRGRLSHPGRAVRLPIFCREYLKTGNGAEAARVSPGMGPGGPGSGGALPGISPHSLNGY